MSDTTQDLDISLRGTKRIGLPMLASLVLYAGQFVCQDTSGRAVNGTDASSRFFAGLAADSFDNSDGADGDVDAELVQEGEALLKSSGLTDADVGKVVFIDDNQTVTKDPSACTYRIPVGTIVEVVDATHAWVRLQPHQAIRPRLFTVKVAGTNAAALDLSGQAAQYGGTGFIVDNVVSMLAYVTSSKASAGMKVVTTNYTVGAGSITTVTDESANTLVITFTGYLT